MTLAAEWLLASDGAFQTRCVAALLDYVRGTVLAEVTNDVQTISVSGGPTGGSFTLGGGPLTAAVAPAWNGTAQAVQAALQAALATGNSCVCTGGPLPGTPAVVTWTAGLAFAPQNLLTISANNLTGGSSPTPTVAHTTVGVAALNHALRASFANNVVIQPGKYLYVAYMIAGDATVQADYTGGSNNQASVTDAHISAAVAGQYNLIAGII